MIDNLHVDVIAEIGWNHMGDMKLAEEMIVAAATAGAKYAKFQTWSVSRLTSGSWDEDGRREIYEKAELSEADHVNLANICKDNSIEFLSSVFSIEDAVLYRKINKKAVKIPSFESTNTGLLNYCNDNFDLVYISFGTKTELEIMASLDILDRVSVVPMHCVSSYPLPPNKANLGRLNYLMDIQSEDILCPQIGYSDHCEGIDVAIASIEHGVSVIEKHFTTDRSLPGRDNKFAILPDDMLALTKYISNRRGANMDRGLDYQSIEKDSRDNYVGRFDGKNIGINTK